MYQELLDKAKALREKSEESEKELVAFQKEELSKAFVALMKEHGVDKIRLVACYNADQDEFQTFVDSTLWFDGCGGPFRLLAMRIGESDELEVMYQYIQDDGDYWDYTDDISEWCKLKELDMLNPCLDDILYCLSKASDDEFPWVENDECEPIPGFDD